MDGMLSQDEINALLSGLQTDADEAEPMDFSAEPPKSEVAFLSDEEKDVIGEVSNICMGSAATALFSILNHRVNITTPKVSYSTWDELLKNYEAPCVFVQIYYKEGIDGNNIFILQQRDAQVIADLMMGGDGRGEYGELSELHLSAISEVMNQMMGSSATALSSIMESRIDISPPTASVVNLTEVINGGEIAEFLKGDFVKISFSLEVGDLINSELMQLYPFEFAKVLNEKFLKYSGIDTSGDKFGQISEPEPMVQEQPISQPVAPAAPVQPMMQQAIPQPQMMPQPQMVQPQMVQPQQAMPYMMPPVQDVNIAPVQFQPFTVPTSPLLQTENIDLLLDVPLEVTAELGRTSKSIKEILDFSPGTIIELNRLAGEPIDVLVNGKYVAKGEVVVIEETFGIKVIEIIK